MCCIISETHKLGVVLPLYRSFLPRPAVPGLAPQQHPAELIVAVAIPNNSVDVRLVGSLCNVVQNGILRIHISEDPQ